MLRYCFCMRLRVDGIKINPIILPRPKTKNLEFFVENAEIVEIMENAENVENAEIVENAENAETAEIAEIAENAENTETAECSFFVELNFCFCW